MPCSRSDFGANTWTPPVVRRQESVASTLVDCQEEEPDGSRYRGGMFALLLAAQVTAAAAAPVHRSRSALHRVRHAPAAARRNRSIYTTIPLGRRNDRVRRALIMVHGTNRNADHYFSTATAAAFLAGALDDTVVIAPRIASADGSCHDTLDTNEVSWSCGGDSWRSGGLSPANTDLSSFDFVDEIVRQARRQEDLPESDGDRRRRTLGGRPVRRRATRWRTRCTTRSASGSTYVVANPSSYAWPDSTRPLPVDDATAGERRARLEGRNAAYEVHVWPVPA